MIDKIEEMLSLVKHIDQEIIDDAKIFAEEFPDVHFNDYFRCLKRLIKGVPIEKIITKFRDYQFELGAGIAKEQFKTVLQMQDVKVKLLHDLEHGKEKGSSTHIDQLDNAWTWRLREFNLWTGYANEGKSLFFRFISLVKAIKDKWKFAFYAPEDFPAEEFFDDIIHMAAGQPTDKDQPNPVSKETYTKILDILNPYFYFVYVTPPENTLLNVFKEFIPLIEKHDVKVCVIDPLIKLSRPKEFMTADDKWAGYVTTLATDFSRQYNISLHLVLHQLTPNLQENGLYPAPNYYKVKGGGTWADGSDNVNSVQRPNYARDKIDDEVIVSSMKIKKQKLVGIPQSIQYRFDRRKNRYVSYTTKKDLFNFEKYLHLPRFKMGTLF